MQRSGGAGRGRLFTGSSGRQRRYLLGPEIQQVPIDKAGNWTAARNLYNSVREIFAGAGQDPNAPTMFLKSGKSVAKQLDGMNKQMTYIVSGGIEEREFPEAMAAINEHLGPGGKFDIKVRLRATMTGWTTPEAQDLGYQVGIEAKKDLVRAVQRLGFEKLGPQQGPIPGWLFFVNNDDSLYVHLTGHKPGQPDGGNAPALDAAG